METVVYNVRDLNDQERTAAEQLVGHELRENQQLRIQVSDAVSDNAETNGPEPGEAPCTYEAPWASIYDGLSEERIDELDHAIRQRANLTRTFE